MPEIPEPSGPPIRQVRPSVDRRIDPKFGTLRWSDEKECWIGSLPRTGAVIHFNPAADAPEEFPSEWADWVLPVDRDPQWIADECAAELKKLHGYGWPVIPFDASVRLVSFDLDHVEIYLRIPALAPHVIQVCLDPQMKIQSFDVAG